MASLLWLIAVLGLVGWWTTGRAKPSQPPQHLESLPSDAVDYLDQVEAELGLSNEARIEIRAELADHVADSIAAMEAEGLDEKTATREALARLGRPEELGRQMRAAHQTTRRLLAGAAGGVFQAAIGTIQGYLIGIVALILLLVVTLPLHPWLGLVGDGIKALQNTSGGMDSNTAIAALLGAVAAFVAARRSVREVARTSRRTVRQVAPFWALAGLVAVGWICVFMVTAYQSWLAVLAELAVPVAFVAGALVRPERQIVGARAGRLLLVAALASPLIVLVLGFGLLTASRGSGSQLVEPVQSGGYYWNSSELNQVAPTWPQFVASFDSDVYSRPGSVVVSLAPGDAGTLDQFRDVRIDIWRGIPWEGEPADEAPSRPDLSSGKPYVTLTVSNEYDHAYSLSFTGTRESRWFAIVTGVAPDGTRYRLDAGEPNGFTTIFSGTVWDWLTASN